MKNESVTTASDGWRFELDLTGNSGSRGIGFTNKSSLNLTGPAGSGSTYSLQQWLHVAAVRSNDTFYLFLDGQLVTSTTAQVSLEDTPHPLRIGQVATTADWFHGYIDEVRIIRGTALWTENFLPPSAPTLGAGD